jgi:hypothetical protein
MIANELEDDSDLDEDVNNGNISNKDEDSVDSYLIDYNTETSTAKGLGKSIAEHILKKQFGNQIFNDLKNSKNKDIVKIDNIPGKSEIDKLTHFIGNKLYTIFRSQNHGKSAIDDAIQDFGVYLFTKKINFNDYFNESSEDNVPKWYKAIRFIIGLARKRSVSAHRKSKHEVKKDLEQEYAELLYRQQHKKDIDEINVVYWTKTILILMTYVIEFILSIKMKLIKHCKRQMIKPPKKLKIKI